MDFKCAVCGQGYFDQDGAAACARAGCKAPPPPAEIVPTVPAERGPNPPPGDVPAAPIPPLPPVPPELESLVSSMEAIVGPMRPPPPPAAAKLIAAARASLGRIVLYRPKPGECKQFAAPEADHYPAVVVRVWSESVVNLQVIPDSMNPWHVTSAQFDPDGTAPGSWSWPPRV